MTAFPTTLKPFVRGLILAGAATLAACGGGGSSAPAELISGVAAAGAPIVGQVTVKDSLGALRTVDIALNGSYSVNVAGMTPPFLFRAQGKVGARDVALVSAATAADINGNLNITPFTDLIIANIAGQATEAYFASNPSAAQLTPAALDAARNALTARLAPVLSELGVAAGFNLLHQAFAANHTGFDQVMDVLRVSVDPLTDTATIRDIINGTQIIDDLSVQTDATVIATPPAGSLTEAVSDLVALQQAMTAFGTMFATSLPSATDPALLNMFASNFLNGGLDRDTFIHELTTDSNLIGMRVTGVELLEDPANSDTWQHISVVVQNSAASGGRLDATDFYLKLEGGVWKNAGDQRPVFNVLGVLNRLSLGSASPFGLPWNTGGDLYTRALDVGVEYAPPAVAYLQVEGPGLAVNSVVLQRNAVLDGWELLDADGGVPTHSNSSLEECGTGNVSLGQPCINFSEVPFDAVYTFTPRDSSKATMVDAPAYTRVLPAPPVTNAEAEAHRLDWFASIVSVTPGYQSIIDTTAITLTIVLPLDTRYALGNSPDFKGDNADGAVRVGLSRVGSSATVFRGNWSGSAPLSAPRIWVDTHGPYDRSFILEGMHSTL